MVISVGCSGNTTTGVAETDVAVTPDAGGNACICDSPTSSCPGVVTGTVTDFDSPQPRLVGVLVEGDQSAQSTLTDTDGEYELEVNICRSPTTVRASLAGYCEFSNTLDISNQRTIRNDVQLQERFVGGVVVDVTPSGLTGEPVSTFVGGIEVRLSDNDAVSDVTGSLGTFLLERVPQEGELTLVASEFRAEGDGCYESTIIQRVRTCGVAEGGQVVELYCRDEANNGCGLCCTGSRVLPEGARPGDFCEREEPCAVGEQPVWACNDDLRGATCSCNPCPEDSTRGEVCDGRDNDCDGVTDNPDSGQLLTECGDADGAAVQGCAEGRCTYVCENGRVDVNGDLNAGAEGNGCECAVTNGGLETCDGLDNDCNGIADDISDALLCPMQEGVCAAAAAACVGGVVMCTDEDYSQHASDQGLLYEGLETLELSCDGFDNNCDSRTDENCCPEGVEPLEGAFVAPTGRPIETTEQLEPQLAVGTDSILAVWMEVDESYRRSVWAAAQPSLGTGPPPVQVNLSADEAESFRPVVAAVDGFAVAFINNASSNRILWQRFDEQGNRQGPSAQPLDLGAAGNRRIVDVRLSAFGDEQIILIWTETAIEGDASVCEHPTGSARCLRARLYNSNGSPASAVFEVTPTTGDAHLPIEPLVAVTDSPHTALVTWYDDAADLLHWRQFDANMNLSEGNEGLELGNSPRGSLVKGAGGYLFAYDARNTERVDRLHFIRIDMEGAILSEGLLGDDGVEDQNPKVLATLGDGRTALLWEQDSALYYSTLSAQAAFEQPPVMLIDGPRIGDVSMLLLQGTNRDLSLITVASFDSRVQFGRINNQGRFMCFNP